MTKKQAFAKRALDLGVAIFGLVSMMLPGVVVAIAIKIESPGPVFFGQTRVGRSGRPFRCWKFRTMHLGSERFGSVTRAGDTRVTSVGTWLRRFKLDELPQLWNVLTGEMSLVGPRPDVPGFADVLAGRDRVILSVRPGITGPASLRFRNEEMILAAVEDPDEYNKKVLFPQKVAINRDYVENFTLRSDLFYLAQTLLPWCRIKSDAIARNAGCDGNLTSEINHKEEKELV